MFSLKDDLPWYFLPRLNTTQALSTLYIKSVVLSFGYVGLSGFILAYLFAFLFLLWYFEMKWFKIY